MAGSPRGFVTTKMTSSEAEDPPGPSGTSGERRPPSPGHDHGQGPLAQHTCATRSPLPRHTSFRCHGPEEVTAAGHRASKGGPPPLPQPKEAPQQGKARSQENQASTQSKNCPEET
ncbi:hypothetical protein MJG53_016491 [Ovis ammon polii x Ovis aries]|uniref:Uncharacterized protein n=1 Tax=Ovis ammon polii x Ovis aries TaxID=2918886 RepID=A0ACB9UBN5_9CETA|nr:hypothetical protein MJG53_016491 [Ovis ammon polii x Ovis aries]